MVLEYNKKYENTHKTLWMNFIGYITPEGEELDYSNAFGLGGHDRNYTTDIFTRYIYYDLDKED